MKTFLIFAICFYGVMRLFCALLLKDKSYLKGEPKPVYYTAAFTAVSALLGCAAGGKICEAIIKTQSEIMLTVICTVCAAIFGIILSIIGKKAFSLNTVYLPTIIIGGALSAVVCAVTYKGTAFKDLLLHGGASALVFGVFAVIWYSILIQTQKMRLSPVAEALSVMGVGVALLSIL